MRDSGKKTRAAALGLLILSLGGLAAFLITGSVVRYVPVDELARRAGAWTGKPVRLAGILDGPVETQVEGSHRLTLRAGGRSVEVLYRGPLPATLEQGREVLLDGSLDAKGRFRAHRLLTRCASRYRGKLRGEPPTN